MALEHRFWMDAPASRHDLRNALVRAGIGLEARPDFEDVSKAASAATLITILGDLDHRTMRPDNDVLATRSVCFRIRDRTLDRQFHVETFKGIVALLRAFPQADAYLLMLDAAIPALLYRNGRLTLAQHLAEDNEVWDAERQPYRALVDLPHTIEPLGPWPDVPVGARMAGH